MLKNKAGVMLTPALLLFIITGVILSVLELGMRNIEAKMIEDAVARLCIEANLRLPDDVIAAIHAAEENEPWQSARRSLALLSENVRLAREKTLPVCQDTGMACVFLKVGQDAHIDGDLNEAVNAGVRRGYCDGYLRKSVVCDPLRRVNTEDNTPALLTVELVPGDNVNITVMPKGFGSENMSSLKMLKPADGVDGVKKFVLDTVETAGANPCPPIIVGVGIGGSFDKAALLAKHALLRRLDEPNRDEYYAGLERELLESINALGIGPQGFGGKTTALGVAIETMPTHVAGLPVAVNISCHATRRASCEI